MRRHDLDLFSLVAGVVFVAIAVGHLLDVAIDLNVDGRWVAPVVLVSLGVAGLAGVLRRGDRDSDREAEQTASQQALAEDGADAP